MNQAKRGFTLIELMVVIAIIAILTSIIFVAAGPVREQSRDTQRQADLREVQTALELYKNRYGRYPERCASADSNWSGQRGTTFACNTVSQPYILGSINNADPADDRPFAEFMVTLPADPILNGNNSGYTYTVNAEGTVYKLMAKNTVESEEVTDDHPFKSCATECDSTIPHCRTTSSQFQTSYAVWGGFHAPSLDSTPAQVEAATEDIICEIP